MPFTLEQFDRTRPFLYHLTARTNVPRIRRTRRLVSAAALMTEAGDTSQLSRKRGATCQLALAGEMVHIRDQAPLHQGNIRFEDGLSFDRLIRDLNARVFFWPGVGDGPISYGARHFERYRDEQPVILRVRFSEVRRSNPAATPFFCKFNSGSPRCSQGRGSIRSPRTFVPADAATFTCGSTVEVTFLDGVDLPDFTECADSPTGPWAPLFG